jgi:hypothetical protein
MSPGNGSSANANAGRRVYCSRGAEHPGHSALRLPSDRHSRGSGRFKGRPEVGGEVVSGIVGEYVTDEGESGDAK